MSTAQQTRIGSVVALWRYPVKSMQGEELNAAEFTEAGLHGDRRFAMVDAVTGKVVSAKNPKKWPDLFRFRAAVLEDESRPGVRITTPDGTTVTSRQEDADQILSTALGREVHLQTSIPAQPLLEEYWPDMDGLDHRDVVTEEAIPPDAFFDGAFLHLLTTTTLDSLRKSYPAGHFEVRRFRPNIVVVPDDPASDFPENDWIGRTFSLGEQARIEITRPCPRCVMTTLAQAHLPNDTGILRTAAAQNQANVGVYATVLQGGCVRSGDVLTRID